jgi:hypothetical protein
MEERRVFDLPNEEQFLLLLDVCIELSKSLSGKAATERLIYSTNVFTKQVLAAYTLWGVTHPSPFPELKALSTDGRMHDFSSAYVLLRSMYETVLSSNYILLDSAFQSAQHVVVEVAELHAMKEQAYLLRNMRSKHPEAIQILDSLPGKMKTIEEHSEFKYLPESIQNYVRADGLQQRNWHKENNESLSVLAGFHKTLHTHYYKYFSNYAHSDPLSVRQVGAVRNPSDAENMISSVSYYALSFLGKSLRIHQKVSDSEGMRFAISQELSDIIKFWDAMSQLDLSEQDLDNNNPAS